MIRTFQNIYTEILTHMGLVEANVDSTILDSVKLRINQINSMLFYRKNYEWRKEKFYITTSAPVELNVDITKGSKAVTVNSVSTGTADDKIKLAYLEVDDKLYPINPHRTVTTDTSFSLKTPFPETTVSSKAARILFPKWYLPHRIASVISVHLNDEEKKTVNRQRLTLSRLSTGEPLEFSLGDRTDFDYHKAGTVTLTQDSTNITGASTVFTTDMEGMVFRTNELAVDYTLEIRNGATDIDLIETYQGDSGSGKGYVVGPKGSQTIQMNPAPDDRYVLEIEGLVKPNYLVRPTDVSALPDHSALLWGSIWWALKNFEEKNPVMEQLAKSNFDKSVVEFDDMYKVINNVAWQSEDEIRARRTNLGHFNPLDRNS